MKTLLQPVPAAGHEVAKRVADQHDPGLPVAGAAVEIDRPNLDLDSGFARFDFTVGDEPYKRDWCDVELKLHDHLAGVTVRGAMAVLLIKAFRRASA